ncbi:hypothetical protein H0H81_001447 [Sphagnurus paluster]|uniref:Nbr1 FW domain-containing protein n=1 Tax=Sphagnurus paluster TaxID=117069 RepID=A0A9P7GII1_9AGAR|nr:hypothetical protein H0H81_001447 [Sphagnurus paluster]
MLPSVEDMTQPSNYPRRASVHSTSPVSPSPLEGSLSPSQWATPVEHSLFRLANNFSPHLDSWEMSPAPFGQQPMIEPNPVVGSHSTGSDGSSRSFNSRSSESQDAEPAPRTSSPWVGGGPNIPQSALEHLAIADLAYEATAPGRRSPLEIISDHSPLTNEALLTRPAAAEPLRARKVTPLAELLHGQSTLRMDDLAAATDPLEEPLSARFIEDITAPDGQIFPNSVTFVKIWRMMNNGTRDWPATTEVVFVGGTQFESDDNSPLACAVGSLKVGEEKNVWSPELKVGVVPISVGDETSSDGFTKAPEGSGTYTSYWRLRDDNGRLFGDSIWIE